ncbi:MAG: 3'-5' exonuclease [Deltaproteobacteria bacterium]|nr:3'-5' exonuclease [Deltaproteobacteria bacterium]MBW2131794.1 3'-5' exonuclease [Deltaproteobacteria bacterium]
MSTTRRFWWFSAVALILTLVTVGFIALLFWHQLTLDEKNIFFEVVKARFIYFFGAGFILLLGLGLILDGIFHLYILPIKRLTEEIQIILSVNPSRRISEEGGQWFVEVASLLNEWADRMETLQHDVDEKIGLVRTEIEEERNIFAAILSELPQGVMICNAEGQILLYDKQTRQFFEAEPESSGPDLSCRPGHFIGLGRSIFGVLEKNRIVHALDEIAFKLDRNEADVSSRFVIVSPAGNLITVEVVPILDACERICTGFALILEDITGRMEKEAKIDGLFQGLTTGIRTSLAAIRSAAEAMIAYPNMEKEKRERFQEIIHHESLTIGDRVNDAASKYSSRLLGRWPRTRTAACDFVEGVKRQAQAKLGIQVEIQGEHLEAWIELDTYSALLAMLFLLHRLKDHAFGEEREGGSGRPGKQQFSLALGKEDGFICLDIHWPGPPVSMETLNQWDAETLSVNNELFLLPLGEVIRHHDAELLPLPGKKDVGIAALRLLFPEAQVVEGKRLRTPLTFGPGSRPEFFDFDLFDHYGQDSDMDDRPLRELPFTVFDTETTGLDLRGGDEIISIGAVRIVNGRLLKEDIFDQLVDPKRSVPPESTRIHGISPEMLKSQPPIEQVLASFHLFAEGTVLVGHNAAFDMKMIQMKETAAGVRFTNPVLDTLLLSAAIHPAQENHHLETIARRLGISIMGRHTALGDAIVTGEIFLKLIALLEQTGIHTLKEARTLSQKTFYARKRY